MELQFISKSGATAGEANGHLMRWASKSLLLDCGKSGAEAHWLDGLQRPEAIWISHAHADHCGALIEAVAKWPKIPVLATATTKTLLAFALSAGGSGADADRARAVSRRVTTVPRRKFRSIPGVDGARIMALGAGHIAGAAMAVVEIEGSSRPRRLLYTGDYCAHDQALVCGAGIPTGDGFSIDCVVSEAMLANDKQADELVWDGEAEKLLADVEEAPGAVLVGVENIGESIEVAAILGRAGNSVMVDDYLRPVFDGCRKRLDDVWGALNFGDRRRMTGRLRGGGVVLASGDQLRRSTSAGSLADPLVDDKRATIVVLNRARNHTPAGMLLGAERGDDIQWRGRTTTLSARVVHRLLINHAPRWQLMGFIRGVAPSKTLLVHGPTGSRWGLKRALQKEGFSGEIQVVDRGETIDVLS